MSDNVPHENVHGLSTPFAHSDLAEYCTVFPSWYVHLGGYQHFGRQIRAAQIKTVLADPSIIEDIRRDLKRTHILFVRIEAIRISLAKHEVRRKKNSVALVPGYGRINRWCGALDYELENGLHSIGHINRRDIADEIRALLTSDCVPTDEVIAEFEEFMRGFSEPSFD